MQSYFPDQRPGCCFHPEGERELLVPFPPEWDPYLYLAAVTITLGLHLLMVAATAPATEPYSCSYAHWCLHWPCHCACHCRCYEPATAPATAPAAASAAAMPRLWHCTYHLPATAHATNLPLHHLPWTIYCTCHEPATTPSAASEIAPATRLATAPATVPATAIATVPATSHATHLPQQLWAPPKMLEDSYVRSCTGCIQRCEYFGPVQPLTYFCNLAIEPNYHCSPSLKSQKKRARYSDGWIVNHQ